MRVETAQIDLERPGEQLPRLRDLAHVLEIVRLEDRIRVEVIRIAVWKHLLHLELRPWPARDDRLGPILDRLTLFAPILLRRIPLVERAELEGTRPSAAASILAPMIIAELRIAGLGYQLRKARDLRSTVIAAANAFIESTEVGA
jgi:hypothetical protein